MSGSEHARPAGRFVWISDEECDYLLRHPATDTDRAIARRWHRAPADSAEAVLKALFPATWPAMGSEWHKVVLRALGHPTNNPTSGGTHE